MTENAVGGRDNIDYLVSMARRPIEDVLQSTLGAKHGERFAAYRAEYRRTLNADRDGFVPDQPISVTTELVNRCNLTCSMCYTANHSEPKATISLEDIEKIVRWDGKTPLACASFGMGSEALLYKNIRQALKSAKDAGVMDIFLFTNGTLLTPDLSAFLVSEGVSRVFVSLDAATPETYARIRGKDALPQIEANIHALLAEKARQGSELPIVRVSFCVQPENRHEQQAFLEKWRDLVDRVDFQVLWDHDKVDEARAYAAAPPDAPPALPRMEAFCHYPFSYLSIWANGDVSPCCNFYGKALVLGNVKTDSLPDIWKGEALAALRRGFLDGDPHPVCRTCIAAASNMVSVEE
jgi:radical SAM protein with 4Fe4S-binding SPASM domain